MLFCLARAPGGNTYSVGLSGKFRSLEKRQAPGWDINFGKKTELKN